MVSLLDFEIFFKKEYEPMVRALTLALGDRLAAEDAAQEGFSKALNRWSRVEAMDRPAAWVYVVALRHARRRLRGRAPRVGIPRNQNLDDIAAVADRMAVREMLERLSRRQRQAVVLRYHADLSLNEIAAALGCRVGTVKATLHQALQALRVSSTEEDRH